METTFCSLKKRRSREEGETRTGGSGLESPICVRSPLGRSTSSSEIGTKHALAAYATGSKANFLVITESHLRAEDPGAIVVEGYEVITEHSRQPDLVKMCGGGQPC